MSLSTLLTVNYQLAPAGTKKVFSIVPTAGARTPQDCEICFFHQGCMDGIAAAWAVRRKYGDKVKFRPIQPDAKDIPADVDVTHKNVFIVDVGFDVETTRRIARFAKSLTIIDHHDTNIRNLEVLQNSPEKNKLFLVLTTELSAAVLTWQYLFPKAPVPDLFRCIEDRDMRRWKHRNSKEISIAAEYRIKEIDDVGKLVDGGQKFLDELKSEGTTLDMCIQYAVHHYLREYKLAKISSFPQYLVAHIEAPVFAGEIGNGLLDLYPKMDVVAIWHYDRNKKLYRISLRSRKKSVDVSKIAESFGGGGHKHAASFTIENDPSNGLFLKASEEDRKSRAVASSFSSTKAGRRRVREFKAKEENIFKLMKEQKIAQEYFQDIVNSHIQNHERVRMKAFPRHVAALVSSPIHPNEISQAILNSSKTVDYVVIWHYDRALQRYNVSLCSRVGGVDVLPIAKSFEGNGSKNFASFTYRKPDIHQIFERLGA